MKRIYIYGIRRAVQSPKILKKRLKDLWSVYGACRGYIRREKENIMGVLDLLSEKLSLINPQRVYETCEPWEMTVADVLKKEIKNTKTWSERKYKKIHVFIDAQIKAGITPTVEERQRILYDEVIRYIQEAPEYTTAVIITRAQWVSNLKKLFSSHKDLAIKAHDLTRPFPFGK